MSPTHSSTHHSSNRKTREGASKRHGDDSVHNHSRRSGRNAKDERRSRERKHSHRSDDDDGDRKHSRSNDRKKSSRKAHSTYEHSYYDYHRHRSRRGESPSKYSRERRHYADRSRSIKDEVSRRRRHDNDEDEHNNDYRSSKHEKYRSRNRSVSSTPSGITVRSNGRRGSSSERPSKRKRLSSSELHSDRRGGRKRHRSSESLSEKDEKVTDNSHRVKEKSDTRDKASCKENGSKILSDSEEFKRSMADKKMTQEASIDINTAPKEQLPGNAKVSVLAEEEKRQRRLERVRKLMEQKKKQSLLDNVTINENINDEQQESQQVSDITTAAPAPSEYFSGTTTSILEKPSCSPTTSATVSPSLSETNQDPSQDGFKESVSLMPPVDTSLSFGFPTPAAVASKSAIVLTDASSKLLSIASLPSTSSSLLTSIPELPVSLLPLDNSFEPDTLDEFMAGIENEMQELRFAPKKVKRRKKKTVNADNHETPKPANATSISLDEILHLNSQAASAAASQLIKTVPSEPSVDNSSVAESLFKAEARPDEQHPEAEQCYITEYEQEAVERPQDTALKLQHDENISDRYTISEESSIEESFKGESTVVIPDDNLNESPEAEDNTDATEDDEEEEKYYRAFMSEFKRQQAESTISETQDQSNLEDVVTTDISPPQLNEDEASLPKDRLSFDDTKSTNSEDDETLKVLIETHKEDHFSPISDEPSGLMSAVLNDVVEKGQDEDLDDLEGEDYRYNLVNEESVQSYFDLVQKVGNKKELPTIDHSQMEYPLFRKNLYIQVREITLMKDHEIDALRKLNGGIRVRGKLCPRPIRTFYQCGLPDAILKVIEKREYEKPFPIQMQALPALMAGRDIIGIAETGSGKTLAYLLPLIRHMLDQPLLKPGDGAMALVLVPTRELAVQIQREAHRFTKVVGLRSIAVYGGTGIGEQLSALKRGSEMVVATPGRLIDVLTINTGKITNLRRVTFCVLDEADRMFDMGFEPQITSILKNVRPDAQKAMFSATFPPHIEALAKKILKKPLEIIVGERGQTASRIEQFVEVWPGQREKFLRLLQLLGEWSEHGSIIIFVARQNDADELFAELLKYGYPSLVLHGGQDQTDRDFTIQDFKEGEASILIATSVAARGLDVKSVVLVINFSAPDHLEDYVHRIGRTGRAGNIGVAYTFLAPDESDKAEDLVKALKQSGKEIPEALSSLAEAYKVQCNMGLAKQRGKGFGGKGFKFTPSEKSRQQQDKIRTKKELGFNESDDEDPTASSGLDDLENPMSPLPPPSPQSTLLAITGGTTATSATTSNTSVVAAAAAAAAAAASAVISGSTTSTLPSTSVVGSMSLSTINDVGSASARAKALADIVTKQHPISTTSTTLISPSQALVVAPSIGTATNTTAIVTAQAAAVAAAAAARSPSVTEEERARQVSLLRSSLQQKLAATVIPAMAAQATTAAAIASNAAAQKSLALAVAAAQNVGGGGLPAGMLIPIPGGSATAYIDPATGNTVEEFDINDYPQTARFKVTHKDVLHRIADQSGAVLQVKGRYVAPEEKDSLALLGVKKLYIEIIGSTPIVIQRAKHELRSLLEAISMKQLNTAAGNRQLGRYSVV